MSAQHARMLEIKRGQLARLKPTVLPSATVRTGLQKSFQANTPQGTVYPATGAPPAAICSYQMPPGVNGALQGMIIVHNGAAGTFLDNSGNLLWHLLRNGYPVPGWENLYAQVGSINPMWQQKVELLLQQNDLLEVLVEVPAGLAPVGTPFATLAGFVSYGGLQTYINQDETRR